MSNSKALMVFGLIGLGATTVGGWSMYYKERKQHEANTEQLGAEIRNHQRHIDSLISKSDLLSARSSELETSLGALKQERDSLSEDMQSVKTEQERLENKQDDLSSNLESVTTEQERLEDEQKDLNTNLATAVSEQERLASEGAELSQNLETAVTEQERLTTEREVLSQTLASVVTEREALQAEHDRLASQLTFMLTARDQLRSDLEATRVERDRIKADLDQKIQVKEAELAQLVSRVEGMNAQLQEASGKIGSLESEVHTLGKERDEITTRFAELKKELESDLQSKDIEIEQLRGDLTVIRVGSDILFDTGSAQLKEAGRDALGHIAAALNEFPDRQVSLEGHTDSVPISEKLQHEYATNWELSTARAARAVRYLQKQGVSPERLRAVGYGPYRPVADNDDPGARGLNRRLEIMLLPLKQTVLEQSLSNN